MLQRVLSIFLIKMMNFRMKKLILRQLLNAQLKTILIFYLVLHVKTVGWICFRKNVSIFYLNNAHITKVVLNSDTFFRAEFCDFLGGGQFRVQGRKLHFLSTENIKSQIFMGGEETFHWLGGGMPPPPHEPNSPINSA